MICHPEAKPKDPIYNWWKSIGIYQRDLSAFDTSESWHSWSSNSRWAEAESFGTERAGDVHIQSRKSDRDSPEIADGLRKSIGPSRQRPIV